MAVHLYWRINITANGGDANYVQTAKLELRATVGGVDQCTGGTAICSTFDPTTPASNAFDANAATHWSTSSPNVTGWIGYQFASPVDVAQYTIQGRSTTPFTRNPRDWGLEWSDDGATWTPVETRSGYTTWTASEIKSFTVVTTANMRSAQAATEVLLQPDPAMHSAQIAVEVLQLPGGSNMRSAQIAVEVMRANSAPIVNDRDLFLQLTTPRYSPSTTAALILSATAPLFRISSGGGASPTSITVTAQLVGLTGTVAFAATGGSALTISGNTATLAYASMVGASETITASITADGVLYTGSYLVGKVTDGAAGTAGARSPGQFAFSGHASWSDAAAVSELATAGYGAPINRDIVTLYNASQSTTKFYDSGSWLTMSAYIDGNLLVSGTISCAKLAADTMTGQTYRTSAGFPRIEVSGASHTIKFYDIAGAQEVIIGGTDASVYVQSGSGFSPCIYGNNTNTGATILPAVAGHGAGGVGVNGMSTNGYAGDFYSQFGTALSAEGGSTGANPSLLLDGRIVMVSRAPGVANSSMNTLLPAVSDYYNCGSSTYVWSQCHASNFYGVYNTPSDARLKADIAPLAPGLSFILALRPVSYTVKEAGRVVTLPPQAPDPEDGLPSWRRDKPKARAPAPVVAVRPGVRTHFGLIAQEVRSALEAAGCADAGAWGMANKNDPTSMQHLNYIELIAPLVKAVQEMAARLAALEKK